MTLEEDIKAVKRRRALDALRKLKRRYPEMKRWAMVCEVAKELGVCEKTAYVYLGKSR